MNRFFLSFILMLAMGAGSYAQTADTSDYVIIDGTVVGRLGVYFTVSVDNWDDIDQMPYKDDTVKVYVYTERKLNETTGPGWVPLLKSVVYFPKEKTKEIELKLLEDFGEKANKLGLGGMTLDKGFKLKLYWKEPVY